MEKRFQPGERNAEVGGQRGDRPEGRHSSATSRQQLPRPGARLSHRSNALSGKNRNKGVLTAEMVSFSCHTLPTQSDDEQENLQVP